MHLNLLVQATPNPFFDGMWRSPEDETSLGYRSLDFWRDLVRSAERGFFDAVIFEATDEIPRFDSTMLLSALAAATSHIGLVTSPDVARLPVALVAEQLSTLDHISHGRVGWRIDDVSDGFIREAVALWEESWAEDAMIFDTSRNEMMNAERIRAVGPGDGHLHPVEPSRQRTPMLFADRWSDPACRFAEVMLLDPVPLDRAAAAVDAAYDAVDAADRSFDEVRLMMTAGVLVGVDPQQVTTLKRHVDRYAGEGTTDSLPFVGTPPEVADRMQQYLDCGLHGFSVTTTPLPGSVNLIADHLVPELQHRKLMRTAYEASSLREHFLGYGDHQLGADHPARRAD